MGIPQDEGLRPYFQAKIEELEHLVRDKAQNLRRLEAQRNEINSKGENSTPQDEIDGTRRGRRWRRSWTNTDHVHAEPGQDVDRARTGRGVKDAPATRR